jgi:hypothetical protein
MVLQSTANSAILELSNEETFAKEQMKGVRDGTLRTGEYIFADR